MASHISEFINQLLAFAGSFPDAAAKIYISHEIIIANVRMVQINVVAANMMSCTNIQTDVGSHSDLTEFLIQSVSYMLNLHCQFSRHPVDMVIPFTGSCALVKEKKDRIHIISMAINQIFFIQRIIC